MNRLLNGLQREIRLLKAQLESLNAALDLSTTAPTRNKLCFHRLCDQKRSCNNRDLPLPSVGVSKLKQLMNLGVNNAVELLGFEDANGVFCSKRTRNAKPNKWKGEATQHFDAKRHRRKEASKRLKAKEAELAEVDTWQTIEDAVADNPPHLPHAAGTQNEALPSLFSDMQDPARHNARFLSAGQVNSIQETEFRHRKPMQDAKMMSLSAEIVKIDWSYKAAGKTHVHTGPGQCFKPHASMFNMQNEDGMTVFWKVTDGGGSLVPLKPDLTHSRTGMHALARLSTLFSLMFVANFVKASRASLETMFMC